MNILIQNCSNTFNYGSMMMGENFISYFNKISIENNKYFVETDDDINIQRLKTATNFNSIYSVNINSLFKHDTNKIDYILSLAFNKDIFTDLINDVDCVIVLGGDDFTEDYGWKGPVIHAIKLNILQKRGLKVVMFGQTMGPYRLFRKPIMKRLLSNIGKLYPRDPITFRYVSNLGLNNVTLTDDLALLPLTNQVYKERTKDLITFCPSELIYKYTEDGSRKEWINFNLFMIYTLLEKYPNKKLVLLAHVLRPDNADDRKIVNELFSLVSNKYKNRIFVENNDLFPTNVRSYLQQSYITISSRMHPIISSIQCETPFIALSYSSKYEGIIGERFELSEYIINVRNNDYFSMKDMFISIINDIDDNYLKIQESINKKNISVKQNIYNALEDTYNYIND